MLRVLKAFFPALILTYLLAVALATASVMDSLRDMGVAVPSTVQIQSTWHDMLGMSSSYLVLLAVTFVLAFAAAAQVARLAGGGRTFWYPLAGAVGVLVLHLVLNLALQITVVAVARTAVGLAGQCLAGAVGGWVFARLSAPGMTMPAPAGDAS
ncbi:hypothetical protein [Parahaliea aestuarii]|uniref:Uncharacterized protein n=1 Tax=Parahaliea aestuarii TaxID=1852021 RepID=A0A5C9A3L0_9GAMM|nr:hypothetical protein [Parahaliea aestuarii]TXS94360.1 hypothetical protein FVW59_00085 [Parahaliea aestuarii]